MIRRLFNKENVKYNRERILKISSGKNLIEKNNDDDEYEEDSEDKKEYNNYDDNEDNEYDDWDYVEYERRQELELEETRKRVNPWMNNFDWVAHHPEDGVLRVQQDGQWGLMSKEGEEILPCEFDSILSFEDGLAAIENYGKWGIIDNKGSIVVPIIFEDDSINSIMINDNSYYVSFIDDNLFNGCFIHIDEYAIIAKFPYDSKESAKLVFWEEYKSNGDFIVQDSLEGIFNTVDYLSLG